MKRETDGENMIFLYSLEESTDQAVPQYKLGTHNVCPRAAKTAIKNSASVQSVSVIESINQCHYT